MARPTASATAILRKRFYDRSPRRRAQLEKVRAEAEVARAIYHLRTSAGLTQKQLARLVGTTESVISRLEDADYTAHSLSMLRRIAAALDQRVVVTFVPLPKPRQSA